MTANQWANVNAWIAYSWRITRTRATMVVASNSAREEKTRLYSLNWPLSACAVPLPDLGTAEPIGLAGLSNWSLYSASPLAEDSGEWVRRLRAIDVQFERCLADLLLSVLLHETQRGARRIVIQGPAFPKLVGRLAYLGDTTEGLDVHFMTFRRRFLLPNPLVGTVLKGGIAGPFPSLHDEGICRRFYAVFREERAQTLRAEPSLLPLMVESVCLSGLSDGGLSAARELFGGQGNDADFAPTYTSEHDVWTPYPNDHPATEKVMIPAPLERVRLSSVDTLGHIYREERVPFASKDVLCKRLLAFANQPMRSEFVQTFVSHLGEHPAWRDNAALLEAARVDPDKFMRVCEAMTDSEFATALAGISARRTP